MGYTNLQDPNGHAQFFGDACRNGSASIATGPGGNRIIVQAQFIPESTRWVPGKDGNAVRVRDQAAHYVYHAQLVYGSGARGPVIQNASAEDITQWALRIGAPTQGYTGDDANVTASAGTTPSVDDDSWIPIVIGLFILAALAGVFLVWLAPILGGAFAVIGDVLSVVLKVGLVAGVFAFAAWLWRAAGPLPGDAPRG